MTVIRTIGSRAQVMHGNAKHTSGGLVKSDLKYSHGNIVSRKKSDDAKKHNRLLAHGYGYLKGKFGMKRVEPSSKKKKGRKGKTRKHRGGAGVTGAGPLGYSEVSIGSNNSAGYGFPDNSTGVQMAAGVGGSRRRHVGSRRGGRRHRGGSTHKRRHHKTKGGAGVTGAGPLGYSNVSMGSDSSAGYGFPSNSTGVQMAAGEGSAW